MCPLNSQQSQMRYLIKSLTHQHRDEAIKLVYEILFKYEPLRKAFYKKYPQRMQEQYQTWQGIKSLFGPQYFSTGFSIGCFDLQNNSELVGVTLALRLSFIPPQQKASGSLFKIFQKIFQQMQQQIIPKYKDIMIEKKSKILEHQYFAIKEQHQGKKLLFKMIALSDQLASEHSLEYSICWASNVKSGRNLEKNGYQIISEVDAKIFEFEGVRYYQEIEEEQKFSRLWLKEYKKN